MVWSQFPIAVQLGVNFGNSVLDNSNWDKISHSLTEKLLPFEEGGAYLRISFWHLLMNFERPKNKTFEEIKKLAGDIIILHMYQKLQSYEVQFLR